MEDEKIPTSRFPLNLPGELNRKIRAMARKDGNRQINGMLVLLLEEAVAAREAKEAKKESKPGNSAPAVLAPAMG